MRQIVRTNKPHHGNRALAMQKLGIRAAAYVTSLRARCGQPHPAPPHLLFWLDRICSSTSSHPSRPTASTDSYLATNILREDRIIVGQHRRIRITLNPEAATPQAQRNMLCTHRVRVATAMTPRVCVRPSRSRDINLAPPAIRRQSTCPTPTLTENSAIL